EHREDYPVKADFRIDAVRLRDQITSPARTVLLVLLAASGLIFVIACSNVANLILARSVRREGELAIRAALGAGTGALRRTQIAASFVLLAGASTLITTLIALQRANPGMNTHNVLAIHVPVNYTRPAAQSLPLYREAVRRISQLPGVEQVAVGTLVPWREAGA